MNTVCTALKTNAWHATGYVVSDATVDATALPYSTPYVQQFSAKVVGRNNAVYSEESITELKAHRPDSSTSDVDISLRTVTELSGIFDSACDERFEDGMESDFSNNLLSIMLRDGEQGVKALCGLIFSKMINAEIAGEALRWLGQINDSKSLMYRFWLLKHALSSSSLRVRDGALLGLSFLNLPEAIPAIEYALQQEPSPSLKADMSDVLMILKATASGGISKNHS